MFKGLGKSAGCLINKKSSVKNLAEIPEEVNISYKYLKQQTISEYEVVEESENESDSSDNFVKSTLIAMVTN